MELAPHLNHLLHLHDCVIVPGLGGFVCSPRKFEFNIQAGFILPARKTVAFNQNLNNNDGLLANHLAQKANTGFGGALEHINAWVGQLHQALQEGKTVHIEGIGSLTLNADRKIVFVPEPNANFLPETYGLGLLKLGRDEKPAPAPKAEKVAPKPELQKRVAQRTEPKKETAALTEAAPTLPPPRAKRKKPSFLRRALLTLLIVLLITTIFLLQDVIYHARMHTGSLINTGSVYTPAKKQNPAPVAQTPVPQGEEQTEPIDPQPESLQKNTDTQPVVETSIPATAKTDSVFYIIAGAFKSAENAQNLLTELENKGYSPKIINMPGSSLYRVGYRQYATRKEAEARLTAVRTKENNSAAWVLAIKN